MSMAFLSGNAILHAVDLQESSITGQPARVFGRDSSLKGPGMELMGATTYGPGLGDWIVRRASHWIFRGTGLENGDAIQNLVGWEYHGPPYAEIEGLEVIASGPLHSYWPKAELEFGAVVFPGPNGGWVFNAATIWWSQALSAPPGHVPGASGESRTLGVDPRVQQITNNFLRRSLEAATPKPSEEDAK